MPAVSSRNGGGAIGGTMRRPWRATCLLIGAVALAASPAAMGVGIPLPVAYNAKTTGSQTVHWSFNGDVRLGGCGSGGLVLQTGTGSGTLTFHFTTATPSVAVASPYGPFSFSFGTRSRATGTMTGSLTFTNGRSCAGFPPPEDTTNPTTACGQQRFRLGVNGEWKSGFLRVWGDDDILFAATPPRSAYADCPLPLVGISGLAPVQSGTACETKNGAQLWQRTNELVASGRGLANVRLAITPKALLHPKTRVTTLARKVVKHCSIKLSNSDAPLLVDVTTQLTLTLRRRG
jgi:hypothetical protein